MHTAPPLLIESLRSGSIASLALMPLGLAFRALELRIGHYGPKFAALYVDDPQPALLFVQHLVIGWVSALPLLWLLARGIGSTAPVLAGAAYGTAYYVLINALALPRFFGDPLPWQLGASTVLPSLIAHMAFGALISFAARGFLARNRAAHV